MKLEPEVLPKLKTQKLNRNLKTLQREILSYPVIWTPVEPSSRVAGVHETTKMGFSEQKHWVGPLFLKLPLDDIELESMESS